MIRNAGIEDAKSLQAIYAPYVLKTAITFDYQVPSITAFEKRIVTISERFPFLVYEEDGQVLGYAYASPYKERAAYDWSSEVSIYLDEAVRGRGIGTQLYDALEQELAQRGLKNCLACITYPNEASENFHHKRGYQKVAHFPKIGYKFDQWHDIIWMQKQLNSV